MKATYTLWVTQAEHDAMANILADCSGRLVPTAAKAPVAAKPARTAAPAPAPVASDPALAVPAPAAPAPAEPAPVAPAPRSSRACSRVLPKLRRG